MYRPIEDLMEGIKNAFPLQMLPWDDYFLRMAETDFLNGRHEVPAVKSFFMRRAPFGGSYALLGGVTEMLRTVSELRFDRPEFQEALRDLDYNREFIAYLAKRGSLKLRIFSGFEGTPFFPNEPIVSAVGDLVSVRLWEGIATEALNFPSLSLTKWNRLARVVRPGIVMDFSRRRAQNHMRATLYGILGGCASSSNDEARRFFDIKIGATFGHEYVQSYGSPKAAFSAWLRQQPRRPIGLIDTVDCMRVDYPAWLEAVSENSGRIKEADPAIWGWRNDSGDLAALTIEQYRKFMKHLLAKDEWFQDRMRIVLTNDLDEYAAESIIAQVRTQAGAAGFDAEDIIRRIIWAAGTKPGSCDDQPSLGGVVKLMEVDGGACLKLAFDAEGRAGIKTSLPGFNHSALVCNEDGGVEFLLIYPKREYVVSEGRLYRGRGGSALEEIVGVVPDASGRVFSVRGYSLLSQQEWLWDTFAGGFGGFTPSWRGTSNISSVQERVFRSVDRLPWQMARLAKPEVMKVCLTPDLAALRSKMIEQGVLRSDLLTD